MLHILKTLIISCILSLGITIVILFWVDNAEELLLISSDNSGLFIGIEKVDIKIKNKKIYIDVHINRPLSCKEVTNMLGIQIFQIKEKAFIPTCTIVNDGLIRVVYTESISV